MLVSFENGFGQSLSYDLLLREVVKAMTCKGCETALSNFVMFFLFIAVHIYMMSCREKCRLLRAPLLVLIVQCRHRMKCR